MPGPKDKDRRNVLYEPIPSTTEVRHPTCMALCAIGTWMSGLIVDRFTLFPSVICRQAGYLPRFHRHRKQDSAVLSGQLVIVIVILIIE